jgi:hypothetical protein
MIAACGGGAGDGDAPPVDALAPDADPGYSAADWLYDPAAVLSIDLTIAPDDWDALRLQQRNVLGVLGETCGEAPAPDAFSYVPASVTIDGQPVDDIGVRKKGFLGSLDDTRPSLILDFDRYVEDQQFSGTRKLTLNNNKQDPSLVHQCLGYGVFAAAGIPAPRCNVAVVSVNGEPLGVYTNVEPLGEPMLGRHFADDEGNLYEGTLSDFRDGWIGTFERKTNESDPSRADLEAVAAALALADDDAMAAALEELIDVDQFMRFWAVETVLAHWDGYAGNNNNFFVYGDPTSGRLQFLPWGTDQIFVPSYPLDPAATRSLLPRRLWLHPASRARYLAIYDDVLATVYDDAALLADVDRLEALVSPHVLAADQAAFAAAIDDLRATLAGREAALVAARTGADASDAEPLAEPLCFDEFGTLAATFDVPYGGTSTDVTLDAAVGGTPVPLTSPAGFAGTSDEDDSLAVLFLTATDELGRTIATYLAMPRDTVAPASFDLTAGGIVAVVLVVPAGGGDPEAIYYLSGTLTLAEGDDVDGAPWTGSLDATAWTSSF